MDFRTEVNITPSDNPVTYRSGILLMGSCFTETIGGRMKEFQFPVDVNPFGINYNPSSVSRNLWTQLDGRDYSRDDLYFLNDRWFSYDHHSNFSHADPETCLDNINKRLEASREKLTNTKTLILTWGTAWVYVHKKSATVVSNCHKVPSQNFKRYLLTTTQIVDTYSKLFSRVRKDLPDLRVILTISPVRHWKDGPALNTVSKSTLVLAAHRLTELFSYCEYFPSYEIAMDDLRDYRFYADDMLHPGNQMIDYIWGKFSGTYFDDETRAIMVEIQKLTTARKHKPFNPDSKQFMEFCRKQLDSIQILEKKSSFLELSGLKNYFSDRLKGS